MRRRFWRAVAKYACARAGLRAVSAVQIGSTVVWPKLESWTFSTSAPSGDTWTWRP